eukprot:2234235-Amphidinium_carterae.1
MSCGIVVVDVEVQELCRAGAVGGWFVAVMRAVTSRDILLLPETNLPRVVVDGVVVGVVVMAASVVSSSGGQVVLLKTKGVQVEVEVVVELCVVRKGGGGMLLVAE